MFKRSKDVIGDVFKGIIIVIAVISGLNSIFGIGSCIFSEERLGDNAMVTLWSIIIFFGSLFTFWLISSVSKIVVYLDDIRQSQCIIAQYYSAQVNMQSSTGTVPTYTENQNQ